MKKLIFYIILISSPAIAFAGENQYTVTFQNLLSTPVTIIIGHQFCISKITPSEIKLTAKKIASFQVSTNNEGNCRNTNSIFNNLSNVSFLENKNDRAGVFLHLS